MIPAVGAPVFPVQNLTVEQADFKAAVIRELMTRGCSEEGARRMFAERDLDYWRCYRNDFTAQRAVTAVVGSWGKDGAE